MRYILHVQCTPLHILNRETDGLDIQLLASRWQCSPVDTLRGASCIFGLDSGWGDGGRAGGWCSGAHGSTTTLYTTLASRRCSEGTKWCIATGCSDAFSVCHCIAPGGISVSVEVIPATNSKRRCMTMCYCHSTFSFFSARLDLPGDLISVFASGAFTLRWFAAKLLTSLTAGCSQEKCFAQDESAGINIG